MKCSLNLLAQAFVFLSISREKSLNSPRMSHIRHKDEHKILRRVSVPACLLIRERSEYSRYQNRIFEATLQFLQRFPFSPWFSLRTHYKATTSLFLLFSVRTCIFAKSRSRCFDDPSFLCALLFLFYRVSDFQYDCSP